jgi:hypothetical protein
MPSPLKVLQLLLLRAQDLSLNEAVVQTGGGWSIKSIATTAQAFTKGKASYLVVQQGEAGTFGNSMTRDIICLQEGISGIVTRNMSICL